MFSLNFDKGLLGSDGTTLGILLTAPNGTKYSSGCHSAYSRRADSTSSSVKNPQARTNGFSKCAEFAVSQPFRTSACRLPGALSPDQVDNHAQNINRRARARRRYSRTSAQLKSNQVLKNRIMDTFSDNSFRPTQT
jgi:hypothetical protein